MTEFYTTEFFEDKMRATDADLLYFSRLAEETGRLPSGLVTIKLIIFEDSMRHLGLDEIIVFNPDSADNFYAALRMLLTRTKPAPEPKPQEKIAPHVSGRAMTRHLNELGVPVQKCVRKQETGDYVADFFVPEMSEPIAPAKEWAKRIREVMPDVRIVDMHDTIAAWRPSQPVIYATVIFTFEGETDV